MPMTWDAQADAKLLQVIIKVYNIKAVGDKLAEVAEMMGPDCTAKALTHRIAKLKNSANTGTAHGAGWGQKTAAPKERTPATPAENSGASSRKRKRGGLIGAKDDTEDVSSKPAGEKTRGKRKCVVDGAEEVLKKIKAEDEGDIEDEGGEGSEVDGFDFF
ncbi:hypothetical protein K431DRAFT_315016 [Polychaeton citri CBS 116435]|uniref:Uncharacterized protein n=1 Tax=Polychaeton citri CBS 116435 TaxID=1314669 RepID=A0A9P4Q2U8_9PEZI|nr:hypothetical protein K431DRAFT_315016 [Polychaeton citri CBS 116435]